MKRYKVIGSQAVLGDHLPGETFDADLADDQEEFLIGVGAIKVVSTDVKSDKRINPDDTSTHKKA